MSDFATGQSQQNTSFFRRPLDNARIRISRLTSSRDDLSELFEGICEITAEALSVERVGVWLFVNNRSAIRCIRLFERSKGLFSEGTTLCVTDFPNYFANLRIRRTVCAEVATLDPRTNELAETYLAPLGITSMLDAPILIDGEVQGVVCNEHIGSPREWTTEERDFAGSVADLTALKIKAAEIGKLRKIIQDLDSDRATARQRESIASMAAGVAHDFRNFLQMISSYASEISTLAEPNSTIREYSDGIREAVQRGKNLTDELMQIARERHGRPRVVNLRDHLATFLPTLQPLLGPNHRLEFKCDSSSGRVFVEPSQIERIVMNLVINARDAMKSGGVITVALDAGHSGSDGVKLTVSDTGQGIDPSILDRIFDPFFTTKPRGSGTGLGLSVVRGAVEHAGGSIHVESHPGQGTTFSIRLPRISAT